MMVLHHWSQQLSLRSSLANLALWMDWALCLQYCCWAWPRLNPQTGPIWPGEASNSQGLQIRQQAYSFQHRSKKVGDYLTAIYRYSRLLSTEE